MCISKIFSISVLPEFYTISELIYQNPIDFSVIFLFFFYSLPDIYVRDTFSFKYLKISSLSLQKQSFSAGVSILFSSL